MNDSVTVLDLITQSTDLILIHRPNLIESILVTLFEPLIFLLEKQEVSGKLLIILCHRLVVFCISLCLGSESNSNVSENIFVLSFSLLETLDSGLVHLFSFSEDSVVEIKLLLIQAVNSFHVLHALLKNLHFFLKLDLLFSLIIGILSPKLLELRCVLVVILGSSAHAVFLKLLVLQKEGLDLILVSLNDLITLSLELLLDLLELLVIIGSHVEELLAHGFDKVVNIVILLFERLHVLIILLLELVNEGRNKLVLLRDDLLASIFLDLNVLSKLFAVLLLFKFLPSPIDFDIFLVTCDDLGLDLVGSLLPLLFLLDTPVVLHSVGVRSDLGDDLRSFSLDLFQETT